MDRGASFIEFYYAGLIIDSSSDLVEYIKANRWYFDRVSEEIQEQFRRKYHILKKMEEKEKWEKE